MRSNEYLEILKQKTIGKEVVEIIKEQRKRRRTLSKLLIPSPSLKNNSKVHGKTC
jgi:hypothetical protein